MSNCEAKCQFRVAGSGCDAIRTLAFHPNSRKFGLPKYLNCETPYLSGDICPLSIAMLDLSQTLRGALCKQQGIIHYAGQAITAFRTESTEIPDQNYPHPSRVFETVIDDLMRMFGMSKEQALSVAKNLEERAGIVHEKKQLK